MNKSILLAGTVPENDNSLITGYASFKDNNLSIDRTEIPLNRGTAAMVAAVCKTTAFFNEKMPFCVLANDIGTKTGSRNVYRHIIKHRKELTFDIFGLHYILPDIGLHNQMLSAIKKIEPQPILVADAGFMYVAKASGRSESYDLFLPDLGEIAFLADKKASHPAYTRGFLTRLEESPEDLISRALTSGNMSKNLCVKGKTDYICSEGKIITKVSAPVVEELEPIGGTGDTITGMCLGLIAHGYPIHEAAVLACRANREAGRITKPSPASQIGDIVRNIPEAFKCVI